MRILKILEYQKEKIDIMNLSPEYHSFVRTDIDLNLCLHI